MLSHTCLNTCFHIGLMSCSAVWYLPTVGDVSRADMPAAQSSGGLVLEWESVISEFGDFPPKWWGIPVNSFTQYWWFSVINTGKRRNLRSNQGSAHQFFTETQLWFFSSSNLWLYLPPPPTFPSFWFPLQLHFSFSLNVPHYLLTQIMSTFSY